MKGKVTLLIVWMLCTLVLVWSVIGMLLFIPKSDGEPSSWFSIGTDLLNDIRKK